MTRRAGFRSSWTAAAWTIGATLACTLPTPAVAQQAGARARVFVAPLTAERGVSERFARKVSDAVRDRLGDLRTVAPIEEDAVDDELGRLELDPDELSPLQWRQLAGQLDADLLLQGTIAKVPAGYAFHVSFIDVRTGEAAAVPEFTVENDGDRDVKEATGRIMDALRSQMDYQRAVLICADYLASEQYEDAARNCQRALEINPNGTTAHYLTGRIEMGRENWDAARRHLAVVVEANPAHTEALNSLAYTESKLGNTTRARELYAEYLGFTPDAADVRMQGAFDLARAGDYAGAVDLLRDGLARDSTNADMWKFLGDVLLNQGTTGVSDARPGRDPKSEQLGVEVGNEAAIRQAIEAYEKVLVLRGAETDPRILKQVVGAQLLLGDVEAAARFAERAERQLPEDASLRALKADILARQKDYAGAVRAMDEALRLDPDLPRGRPKRGLFRLSADDEAGAMADFRAAVEAGEEPDVLAQQMLGRGHEAYFQTGQYDRAATTFEAALEFARQPATTQQLQFFTAFSYYQAGAQIDAANQEAEACGPARRALERFQQVLPHLNRAGDTQAKSQAEIRAATDAQLYRQQAILNKPACR